VSCISHEGVGNASLHDWKIKFKLSTHNTTLPLYETPISLHPLLHPNSTKSKKEYQESKKPCVVLNDIIGNDQKLIKGMFGKKGDGGRGE
jgi:hypothetical protein